MSDITEIIINGTRYSLKDASAHSVPSGGTQGQVLKKSSATDYELEWATPSETSNVELTATFPSSGWSSTSPYTNQVAVSGVLATDHPIVDVSFADVADADAEDVKEAFGCVDKIVATSGYLTATCYSEKPETSFTVNIKIVR